MQTELQSVSNSTDKQLLRAEHWGAEDVQVRTKLCPAVDARMGLPDVRRWRPCSDGRSVEREKQRKERMTR